MRTTNQPEMVERIARSLMDVMAQRPGGACGGKEVPVLDLDPDFDDLPANGSEGTEDDDITQEAVLRLARAALEAIREPTREMRYAALGQVGPAVGPRQIWQAMVDAALGKLPA